MRTSSLSNSLFLISLLLLVLMINTTYAQKYEYEDAWSKAGFNLNRSETTGLEIIFSIDELSLSDFDLKGEAMKQIHLKESYLPNNEGAPNLPGNGRFIAVPNGAEVSFKILSQRIETYQNVNIAPSPTYS